MVLSIIVEMNDSGECYCGKKINTYTKYKLEEDTIITLQIQKCPVNEYSIDSKLENFEETDNKACEYYVETVLHKESSTGSSIHHSEYSFTNDKNQSPSSSLCSPKSGNTGLSCKLAYFIAEQKRSTLQELINILPKDNNETIEDYIQRFQEYIND